MKNKPSIEQSRDAAALLRRKRSSLGLTQQQVARRAGVVWAHYQKFEGGQRCFLTARFKTVMAILEVLGINAKEFSQKYGEVS
jgi:predicted transcriptional regulator